MLHGPLRLGSFGALRDSTLCANSNGGRPEEVTSGGSRRHIDMTNDKRKDSLVQQEIPQMSRRCFGTDEIKTTLN